MFTLPLNLPQPIDYGVLPGKNSFFRTWNLKIIITPGLINDDKWAPLDLSQHFKDLIRINITFGDILLDKILGNQPIVLEKDFEDSNQPQWQKLVITFSEKDINTPLADNEHSVIRIQIFVENILITNILETIGNYCTAYGETKLGAEFIGENGKQSLEIYTPIYVWLLEHQDLILPNTFRIE